MSYDPMLHARATDPATSHEAAEAHTSMRVRQVRAIEECLRYFDRPMAAEELADYIGSSRGIILGWPAMDTVKVCKRLKDLERAGLIQRTSKRHRNRSGRYAFKVKLA